MPAPLYYTHNGMTLTLADWAKRTGINKRSLRSRIKMGWPMERVISRRIHKGTDPEEFKELRIIRISAEEIFRMWARLPPPR